MRRFLVGLALWIAACWTVVSTLLAPVLPGGWGAVLALVVLTTAPIAIIAIVVRDRRSGRTPGGARRVWVLRPFVYAQLLLPLLAIVGALGALGGAVVGAAGTGGRWAIALTAA